MKKTMKKLTALILTVLMLFSALSVTSFAAGLDFLKAPTVTKVALSEKSYASVSLKEMKTYFKELEETIKKIEEQYGYNLEELIEKYPALENTINSLMKFDLGNSGFYYEYDVTLSNGKTYTVPAEDGRVEVNAFIELYVDAYVSKDEYLKAANKGAKTIKLDYKAQLYSNVLQDYTKEGDFEAQEKISVVSSVVKSISPVSGFPTKIYEYADFIDLDGAKFKIKYADGTEKTAKVVQNIEMKDGVYTGEVSYELDGKPLYVIEDYYDDDSTGIKVYFLDAEYGKKLPEAKCPFKSVKIKDCVYDFEKGLQSITYTITPTSGKSKTYTKEITGEMSISLMGEIDAIDGYFVYISPIGDIDYEVEEKEEELKLRIYVCIGDIESEPAEFDIPYSDSISFVIKVVEKITEIMDYLSNIIDIVIGMFAE